MKKRTGPFGGIQGKQIAERFSMQENGSHQGDLIRHKGPEYEIGGEPISLIDQGASFTSARNSVIFSLNNTQNNYQQTGNAVLGSSY